MGIGTLFLYLIGNRGAILALAGHPRAWLVGLVFVVSAGFARKYDSEDLLHDPWYLLLPLAASLGSSFLLFCVLYWCMVVSDTPRPSFLRAYLAFLNLFWLTAPLAWLYALPYERTLTPVSAVHANLLTLAIVSAWRVALMVRVAVVLMDMSPLAALCLVMAYADGVALVAVYSLPFPIIEVMGGVHLTEAESALRGARDFVCCCGGCSFPIWLLLLLGSDSSGGKLRWQLPIAADVPQPGVSWPLRILAFVSVTIWIGILPFTQPEQQVRRQVDSAFHEGRLTDGLALMSEHSADEFPPHWEPPPRFLKRERESLIFDIWNEILRNDVAPWVRQRYLEKLKFHMGHGRPRPRDRFDGMYHPHEVAELINRMPEGSALLLDLADEPWILEQLDPHLRPEWRKESKVDDK